MTPRRCTTETSGVHATWNWNSTTFCGEHSGDILRADNTDPVTCTRCLEALTRLGDAIDACIEGRSG